MNLKLEDGELFIQCGCRALVFPGVKHEPDGVSYVRVIEIVDDHEEALCQEIAYWDSDEWRDAPEEVMGAILGALFEGVRGDE